MAKIKKLTLFICKGATGSNIPSKIIQRGPLGTTFHHEDLGMSQTEENVKQRIRKNAPMNQSRATQANARKVSYTVLFVFF